MTSTSTGARRSARAANSPPKPQPTIATRLTGILGIPVDARGGTLALPRRNGDAPGTLYYDLLTPAADQGLQRASHHGPSTILTRSRPWSHSQSRRDRRKWDSRQRAEGRARERFPLPPRGASSFGGAPPLQTPCNRRVISPASQGTRLSGRTGSLTASQEGVRSTKG